MLVTSPNNEESLKNVSAHFNSPFLDKALPPVQFFEGEPQCIIFEFSTS